MVPFHIANELYDKEFEKLMKISKQTTSTGYHLINIPKGEFGEFSKIKEEVLELEDAIAQECSVMALVELSDLIGAIDGYLSKHHPTINLDDLITMSKITQRAFKNGHR